MVIVVVTIAATIKIVIKRCRTLLAEIARP